MSYCVVDSESVVTVLKTKLSVIFEINVSASQFKLRSKQINLKQFIEI